MKTREKLRIHVTKKINNFNSFIAPRFTTNTEIHRRVCKTQSKKDSRVKTQVDTVIKD